MHKPDNYPTNFQAADNDRRVFFVNATRQEARDLFDAIDDPVLGDALDEAQGAADGKTAYLILRIKG